MPRFRTHEDRVNRAISIAQFFAEGGHTISDGQEEFGISSTMLNKELNLLKECLLDHHFKQNPQKEKQVLTWYKTARKNLYKNRKSSKKSN